MGYFWSVVFAVLAVLIGAIVIVSTDKASADREWCTANGFTTFRTRDRVLCVDADRRLIVPGAR